MLESSLKRAVARRLDEVSGLVWRKRHGSAFQTAGDPDIYGLWRGRHLEIELKVPGEEATRLQARRLEEWRGAGAAVAVIHSLGELEVFLEGLGIT